MILELLILPLAELEALAYLSITFDDSSQFLNLNLIFCWIHKLTMPLQEAGLRI